MFETKRKFHVSNFHNHVIRMYTLILEGDPVGLNNFPIYGFVCRSKIYSLLLNWSVLKSYFSHKDSLVLSVNI